MQITQVVKLFNEALAGESLTLREALPHLDSAIDRINSYLNAAYPVFSSLDTTTAVEYNFFPDQYIRTVVIPGAAWHYYVMDEEGLMTAPQYQRDFEQGLFVMLRDMLYKIPAEYQADPDAGIAPASDPNDRIFGNRELTYDRY